ncbi:sodium pump decarboxylase subunit gamma [Betaproteobacteria bacterium]|nr:sodium pump decarboxylase subunit gamma [Betaproteobacteria bacterium]
MENIDWGLKMTALGMTLVFGMLALLWALLTLVLKLDKEEEEPAEKASAPETSATSAEAEPSAAIEGNTEGAQPPARPTTINGLSADLVLAILIATHKHRQTMRRQAAPLVRAVWPGSQIFASRWLAAGRARQTNNWQPRGR